jgi:general secretion pathway protein C
LVPLAVSAHFVGSGAAALLGAAFIARATNAGGVPLPLVPPGVKQRTAAPILSRQPFDSVTRALDVEAVAASARVPNDTALAEQDPLRVAACEGITTLITTEASDRRWSVATLQGPDEARPSMRRVGSDVAGRRVEYIGYNPAENSPAVWLSRGGTLCQALLFRPPPPSTPATAPEQRVAPASGSRSEPPEEDSKIRYLEDTEYRLDHASVDEILEHQAELLKFVHIVPEQSDGRVIGIRLLGVRSGTLLATLGLRDGDLVESINGYQLGNPAQALEAYARLRTATNLNVKLTRQGHVLSIDYRID